MEGLLYFILGKNKINIIPKSIVKLKEVSWVGSKGNQLTSLPESIVGLTELENLELTGNPISQKEQEKIIKLLPDCKTEF